MSAWIDKIKQLDLKQADRLAPVALALAILVLCWKLAALLAPLWLAGVQTSCSVATACP